MLDYKIGHIKNLKRRHQRLFWLHKMLGLTIATFIALICISGTLLVFRTELDHLLNTDWFYVEEGKHSLPPSVIFDHVRSNIAGRPISISFAESPTLAHRILLEIPSERDKVETREVFLDPYTGEIKGHRTFKDGPYELRSLFYHIRRFHHELLLDIYGYYFIGTIGCLWLALLLTGLYLAWPKKGRWKSALSIKFSRNRFRTYFDLHRVTGFLSAIIVISILSTGLWWNLSFLVRPFVSYLSSSSLRVLPTSEFSGNINLGILDQILHKEKQSNNGRLSRIVFDYDKGVYRLWSHQADQASLAWIAPDMNGGSNQITTYDMKAGQALGALSIHNANAVDIYAGLQYPIHTGQFFGLGGRILWVFISITPAFLVFSGIYLWWKKRKKKTKTI